MSDGTDTASGVQALVSRLRDEGVMAAREEANKLIAEAKREAAEIVEQARQQARRERAETERALRKEREAALAALQLAARDASQSLLQSLTDTFETHVRRLVATEVSDPGFLRELLLAIAGSTGADYAAEHAVRVELAEAFFQGEPTTRERTQELILGLSRDMLRKGVSLVPSPDIEGGARIHIEGDNSDLDLSAQALSALLLRHLLPRFRSVLEGIE